MNDAVIVEAVRTPVGKGKPAGALSGVHPVASSLTVCAPWSNGPTRP
jgi:acetyl-CoA acyltransferase